MKSVILVTGAGIGKLSAQALARAGHVVYASMRDIEGRNRERAQALRSWARQENVTLHPLDSGWQVD